MAPARLPHATLALLLFAFGPTSAAAQTASDDPDRGDVAAQPADDPRDAEARATFEAGSIAYEDGRYEDALASFERAYALSARPQLLYNMAACAANLRRDHDAVRWYEQYLDEVPDAPNRRAVEARVAHLRDALDHDRSAGSGGDGDVQRETPWVESWWFWTIVGVVVVGAAVGVTLAVTSGGGPVQGDVGPGGVIEALRW